MARDVSARKRFEILKRDGFRCVYCGCTPLQRVLHVDHVVAVANGGTNHADNLVVACQGCNLGKGAVPLEDTSRTDGSAIGDAKAARERNKQVKAYLAAQRELASLRAQLVDEVIAAWDERVRAFRNHESLRSAVQRALDVLPFEAVLDAVGVTAWKSRQGLSGPASQVAYFCAVVRNKAAGR